MWWREPARNRKVSGNEDEGEEAVSYPVVCS